MHVPQRHEEPLATSTYKNGELTIDAPRDPNFQLSNEGTKPGPSFTAPTVPIANRIFIEQHGDTVKVTVHSGDEKRVIEQRGVNKLVIRTGDGNDLITTGSASDNYGDKKVNVDLEVHAGGGNDDVIGSWGGVNTLYGEGGDDGLVGGTRDDVLDGGDGADYLEGVGGDDQLYGAMGNDVMYGGLGDDLLMDTGGELNYFEGGKDNDRLLAMSGGKNVLSGGRGDDQIQGWGDDTVYTGLGNDNVLNVFGHDTVYAQQDEDKTSALFGKNDVVNVDIPDTMTLFGWLDVSVAPGARSIKMDGSASFVDRMEDDIDMYRASPTGQTMLRGLDDAHARIPGLPTVTLKEAPRSYLGTREVINPSDKNALVRDGSTVIAGEGGDATIAMQPSNPAYVRAGFEQAPDPLTQAGVWFPGSVWLYHEMSHTYNQLTGTYQPGPGDLPRERQTVGLENDGLAFDFDGDPATAPTTTNPRAFTENGIRAEMGIPERPFYHDPHER